MIFSYQKEANNKGQSKRVTSKRTGFDEFIRPERWEIKTVADSKWWLRHKSTKKASSIKRPHLHCLLVTACHGLILSQKAVLKSVEVLPLFCLTDASWILPPNVYLQYFEIWNLGRTFELNDYNALKSDMSSYDYSHLFYLVMEAKLVPDNFPESSKWCSYRWKIEKGKLL